ncbi:hypothetical protein RCH16_003380 [Cryobacterium sp. MP_M5]|uniref:hypothetical protein n=1 Tax=unclassified Cryobacterium TaxID=2649013 RepID=UPI0018CBA87D|nr:MULTISPECIES: hypothetical protein [unclassified Cryobacterium]MBG6059924.1 hypothetical protein [Cryobacterium sp. MP_M3]MEC5178342.1 hypothetical protein [Cryobacterium sp. MP_M5]
MRKSLASPLARPLAWPNRSRRARADDQMPRADLHNHFSARQEPLTVLVASAAGAPASRGAVWSAALQEYPLLRVVLPDAVTRPGDPDAGERLSESHDDARDIAGALSGPRARFSDELLVCELELTADAEVTEAAVRHLAAQYRWAANWLATAADAERRAQPAGALCAEQVLRGLAAELDLTAATLTAAVPTAGQLLHLYRRLVWIFSAEFDTSDRGPEDAAAEGAGYLLTLGPGALLPRDYCLRLVYTLEQSAPAQAAVAAANARERLRYTATLPRCRAVRALQRRWAAGALSVPNYSPWRQLR